MFFILVNNTMGRVIKLVMSEVFPRMMPASVPISPRCLPFILLTKTERKDSTLEPILRRIPLHSTPTVQKQQKYTNIYSNNLENQLVG